MFDLLEQAGSGGNLSTDALIAALALKHGGEVYSKRLRFRSFSGCGSAQSARLNRGRDAAGRQVVDRISVLQVCERQTLNDLARNEAAAFNGDFTTVLG